MAENKTDGNLSSFAAKAKGVKIERTTSNKQVAPVKDIPERKKVVKDTFTFPEDDYKLIGELEHAYLLKGKKANKSEIVRAGLHALQSLSHDEMIAILDKLERVKVGRPKKKQ